SCWTISQFGCLLYQRPTVRFLHKSFADYISDKARCGTDRWYLNFEAHNLRLAIQCLSHLNERLKRNINNLTLSPGSWNERLPEDVSYACIYWIDYLCAMSRDGVPLVHPLNSC